MYNKLIKNKENIKNVVIAILLTGILAFIAGTKFESRANKQIEQARAEVSKQITQVEVKK